MGISEPWTWSCREVLQAAHATGATLLREAVQGAAADLPLSQGTAPKLSPWAAGEAEAN